MAWRAPCGGRDSAREDVRSDVTRAGVPGLFTLAHPVRPRARRHLKVRRRHAAPARVRTGGGSPSCPERNDDVRIRRDDLERGGSERCQRDPARGHQGRGSLDGAPRQGAPVLAGRQLPDGRADLPARQSAPWRAPPAGAHQAPAARPLGHVAGAQLRVRAPQSADRRTRRRHDRPRRPRPRRTRDHRERVPRRHLLGGLSRDRTDHGRPLSSLPPVLDARRRAQPCQRADPRINSRGRRTGLRARPRLRRGLRQPGPGGRRGGRRRGGGNRPAGRRPGRA